MATNWEAYRAEIAEYDQAVEEARRKQQVINEEARQAEEIAQAKFREERHARVAAHINTHGLADILRNFSDRFWAGEDSRVLDPLDPANQAENLLTEEWLQTIVVEEERKNAFATKAKLVLFSDEFVVPKQTYDNKGRVTIGRKTLRNAVGIEIEVRDYADNIASSVFASPVYNMRKYTEPTNQCIKRYGLPWTIDHAMDLGERRVDYYFSKAPLLESRNPHYRGYLLKVLNGYGAKAAEIGSTPDTIRSWGKGILDSLPEGVGAHGEIPSGALYNWALDQAGVSRLRRWIDKCDPLHFASPIGSRNHPFARY